MKNGWEIEVSTKSAYMIQNGIMVIIDEEQLDKVKNDFWNARLKRKAENIEVSTITKVNGRRTTMRLTRKILGIEIGSDELVVRCDVSDKDIFDARVSNLVIYPEYRERDSVHYSSVKRKKAI
jgi:hypothetical protein